MKEDLVGAFFNRQAAQYGRGKKAGMVHQNQRVAAEIERNISGDVLCVGGLWSYYDREVLERTNISVVDASSEMLANLPDERLYKAVGDARELNFSDSAFDHVVLPMILHHVTDQSAIAARQNVHRVLKEAYRVLRPGGGLWISDFVVSPVVYRAERKLARLTTKALAAFDIPLVVMHSEDFYKEALRRAGFGAINVTRIVASEARSTDWVRPVIGLPLIVPRWMYPVRSVLIAAARS